MADVGRSETTVEPLAGRPLPRYKRAREALPGLVLQERDRALLEDVWRYRWLTTSQLETLRRHDPDLERRFVSRLPLTRRLKLLFHHGYLSRFARPLAQGSLEPVYRLDRAGARVLRERFENAAARAPSQRPRPAALEHLLLINQMRVSLVVACYMAQDEHAALNRAKHSRGEGAGEGERGTAPPQLVQWQASRQVKFSVFLSLVGERTRSVTLIPDGYFALSARGQRLFYFLEADLDTEPKRVLVEKCRAYYRYWQEGGFARDFSVPPSVGFRVLFVVPTLRRAETVLSAVAALPSGQGFFWVTTREHLFPERILATVWRGCSRPAVQAAAGRWSLLGEQESGHGTSLCL